MFSENIKTSNSMGYLLLNVTNRKINEEVGKALWYQILVSALTKIQKKLKTMNLKYQINI